jgi:ribonuclease Z
LDGKNPTNIAGETMIIVPLGVASATPTATRHLSSVALWREGDIHLFDCGENAQMRMLQAGLKRSKIENIFISHFDVDHYSGLIGLISTLQLQRREKPLTIVGPKGIKKYVEWNLKFANVDLNFDIKYSEVDEGFESKKVVDSEEYYVEARPLNHTKFCMGFRFQEKDKPGKVDAEKATALGITEDEQFKALKAGDDVKLEDGTVVKSYDIVGHPRPGDSFAYISDTKYCPNSVKLAMNTNILYHEATFSETLADKAAETGHSTSIDAARVANEAQTKLLVISHFSARYTNPFVLLREARAKFFPAWLATELRPIYTDPAQEKGIVKQKVYLKEIDESKTPEKPRSGGRNDSKKNFRKRRTTSGSSSRRSSDRRSSSSSSKRDDYSERRKRRPDNQQRERKEYNQGTSRPPKHITPRTPFDDFDRF